MKADTVNVTCSKCGMTMPVPNQVLGSRDRATSPRRIASAPLGRIFFAGQETEGTPSVESAIASGQRAAPQVLSVIP